MTRTRWRFAALVATFVLTVTALSLGQSDTARADDYCDFEDQTPPAITALNPAVITLGLVPQPVRFSIDSSDECGIAGWSIDTPGKVLFFVYKEIPEDTVYPPANKNAGPTPVDVRAIDQAYNQQKRRLTLRLLRETRWQTNEVTSAPVEKGQPDSHPGHAETGRLEQERLRSLRRAEAAGNRPVQGRGRRLVDSGEDRDVLRHRSDLGPRHGQA